MRKLIFGLLLGAVMLMAGCGNQQILDTTWSFNRAIIIHGDESYEVEVQSWRDFENSDMIQIRTTEGKTYLSHSSNIILIQE